jgi:hypothetical protein
MKNLYKNDKCRFCSVGKSEKHLQVYHGAGDMLGYAPLDIEYIEDDQK